MTTEQVEKYRQALDAMREWRENMYRMYTCCRVGNDEIELGISGHGSWEVRRNGEIICQQMQITAIVEYYNNMVPRKYRIGV